MLPIISNQGLAWPRFLRASLHASFSIPVHHECFRVSEHLEMWPSEKLELTQDNWRKLIIAPLASVEVWVGRGGWTASAMHHKLKVSCTGRDWRAPSTVRPAPAPPGDGVEKCPAIAPSRRCRSGSMDRPDQPAFWSEAPIYVHHTQKGDAKLALPHENAIRRRAATQKQIFRRQGMANRHARKATLENGPSHSPSPVPWFLVSQPPGQVSRWLAGRLIATPWGDEDSEVWKYIKLWSLIIVEETAIRALTIPALLYFMTATSLCRHPPLTINGPPSCLGSDV